MKYMLLIYSPDVDWSDVPPEAQQAELDKWFRYTDDLGKAGVLISGDALQATSTATCVSQRDGKDIVTDGPYAETKESLGGYYLLDVPSVDEAIEWAKKCPGAAYGTIELRPFTVFDQPGGAAS